MGNMKKWTSIMVPLLNYDDNGRSPAFSRRDTVHLQIVVFHCHLSFQGFIPEFIHLYIPPKATCALNRGHFKGKVLLQTPS